jgi:3-deoxy-manno-octulosonate cytidylyltransferase (CMP-KDO synthetase)
MNNIAIFIPVRLASSRLPSKPLADICGKSMIQRVYEKAIESGVSEVFIACDGEEISNSVKKFGAKTIITNPSLPSGTDRVYAACKQLSKKFDIVINLQGDLPNIDPKAIFDVVDMSTKTDCDIGTIASIVKNKSEIDNPNVVKIAISFDENHIYNTGRALYFSRSAIPHSKEKSAKYFHHIGVYAYKMEALERFVSLKPSYLEKIESLEQLRALEDNMKIMVKIVDTHPISVDTINDLENVRNYFNDENKITNYEK